MRAGPSHNTRKKKAKLTFQAAGNTKYYNTRLK